MLHRALQSEAKNSQGENYKSRSVGAQILLVDDNQIVLDVTSEILIREGYKVESSSSAEQALTYLKTHHPDIIISDIMMPGMDGYRFYEQVGQDPELCAIPFVFLTALGSAKEMRYGKELGCDDYVVKPFEPSDLLATVRGKLQMAGKRESVNQTRVENYRRRVINTLSHEFRTPLVAINTGSELLIEQHEDLQTDRIHGLLNSIHRGGQRLQRLINDFMALQQVESGAAALASEKLRTSVPVAEILQRAIDNFRDCYDESTAQLNVHVNLDDYPVNVLVCEAQLIDVVDRLLGNAAKFAGHCGPIALAVECDDTTIRILVCDRGPGFSAEKAQLACQIFTQLDRDKLEQQGCGLGLAIANYYTELNGGKLIFNNPAGGGFEVGVELPCLRA